MRFLNFGKVPRIAGSDPDPPTFPGRNTKRMRKPNDPIILNAAALRSGADEYCLAVMLLAFSSDRALPGLGAGLAKYGGWWSGTCTHVPKASTGLRLAIFQTTASSVTAMFKFSADGTNPGVPSGRYWMSGTYHRRSGKIALRPSRWIKRPTNYVMSRSHRRRRKRKFIDLRQSTQQRLLHLYRQPELGRRSGSDLQYCDF